jgi:tRNA threonylcarbamoyladenosine biosynthesis protein TsaB
MKVLGIDTSTPCGSVGLIEEDRIISESLLNIPVTHSERLLNTIETVLRESYCDMGDLDGWAISLGPGSFTGLRIGISAIKGLAFATQKPVAGVSTLDVLAFQTSPTPYLICPILDARKNEVYAALYRYDGTHLPIRESDYWAIRPEDLVRRIKEKTVFIGNGVETYGDTIRSSLPSFAIFPPCPLHYPLGSSVAKLGLKLLQEGGALDLATFTPIYVRSSEAEIKWKENHPD